MPHKENRKNSDTEIGRIREGEKVGRGRGEEDRKRRRITCCLTGPGGLVQDVG